MGRIGFVDKNFTLFKQIICLTFLLLLSGCESEDDIPVTVIDQTQTLSDQELASTDHDKDHHSHSENTEVIYFGFDLRASPQQDAAQYLPFLKYLEEKTGYHFKLHFSPKNSSTVKELGRGITQIAAMGATSFLEAQQKHQAISLVRGLNHMGKAEYQSVFVVRPNSRIKTITQFKNKRLAFGSPDSTQGHLIPRIILQKNGITLNDLKSYDYTGSHQNCAESVVSGKSDICGMQDQLAKSLAQQGLVKIIHFSNYYPSSGIVASTTLDSSIREKIIKALLEFEPTKKHRDKLFNWDKTEMPLGFTSANEQDYSDLKKWSIKLGFLEQETSQDL